MRLSPAQRAKHTQWLLELTQVPTAAGREFRVERWIEGWVAERPRLAVSRDRAGNMTITDRAREALPGARPVYITAHLDHPAFVVERIAAPGVVELSFRGGVLEPYFRGARIVVWNSREESFAATLFGDPREEKGSPYKIYQAEFDLGAGARVEIGDVGVWELPGAEVLDGLLHTNACDDLAAAAAALCAFDVLTDEGQPAGVSGGAGGEDVRLLFTRAEEVGFIGAIAAVREGTVPRESRVITLENSRSFPESPIGGGVIVRVGDRMSVFSPRLTEVVAKRAEDIAKENEDWKWQRKLMAGGSCEASVFCHAGYEATCVCLALGNYHNMAGLTEVQAALQATAQVAGAKETKGIVAKVGREYISVRDFESLVDLLIACGRRLPVESPKADVFEKLWKERSGVLGV